MKEPAKYNADEIKNINKYSKFGFRVFILLIFIIIFSNATFDKSLMLKDKILGILINSTLLLLCYFAGEKFLEWHLKKKLEK